MEDNKNSIGVLIDNTGSNKLNVSLHDSFSVRRGEFVRILHQEFKDNPPVWVLAKVVKLSRENILFKSSFGSETSEVELIFPHPPGENNFATLEILGYKELVSGEIKFPRRALNPGSRVYKVDTDFLNYFYEFNKETSIKIGHLIGYEKGDSRVPVFLDIDKISTEHLALLAMTGAGKSYTIGRIAELMLAQFNASIVVFDPHGEYGNVFRNGKIHLTDITKVLEEDKEELEITQKVICEKLEDNGGIKIYAPKNKNSDIKYSEQYKALTLRLDDLKFGELKNILPNMSEPQERLFFQAYKYWKTNFPDDSRSPEDLLAILGNKFDKFKASLQISEEEKSALNRRSASIIALRLRNLIQEANIFWYPGKEIVDIKSIVGLKNEKSSGQISIIDLQSMSKEAMQVVIALICNKILNSSADLINPIRPVFLIFEEAHLFIPSKTDSISMPIIKKISSEGRKFGVGMCVISQRPSKLDPDVTSQCNTIIIMRIKNPDDQRFLKASSDLLSESDLQEIPSLSTGEALICGRGIIVPITVKVGLKALEHGGESPKVSNIWRGI